MKLKCFNDFVNESKKGSVDWSLLNIQDNKIRTYHYSNIDITDNFIRVNRPSNLHSRGEFKTWGRSRSFFYCLPGGWSKDRIGTGHKFRYEILFDVDKVYDINANPDGFKITGQFQDLLGQTMAAGYQAWIYNLGGDVTNPIIVAFVDMPIDKAYEITDGGTFEKGVKLSDYKIGEIIMSNKKWDVIQKARSLRSFRNTYLRRGRETKSFSVYDYLFKRVEVLPEFKGDYVT